MESIAPLDRTPIIGVESAKTTKIDDVKSFYKSVTKNMYQLTILHVCHLLQSADCFLDNGLL